MGSPGEEPVESQVPSSDLPTVEAAKLRLKRPIKPNAEEHRAAVDQLQDELNKRRDRSENIRSVIDQKRGQAGGGPEVQAARSKLDELTASFKSLLDKKKATREQMNTLNGSRDGLRSQLREQKQKLGPYTTVQKIEERIRALEHMLTHTSVDLKEEMKVREEMKKTLALKPLAAAHLANQEKLKASEAERERMLAQLKASDEKLNAIKAQEDQQRDVLNSMREKDAAKSKDVPALYQERDECREVMSALYQKIKELKAEFKEKNNEFFQESQAWREQQKADRAEKDAQREKEYQTRQAERQAAAAEFAGEPYHKEIGLCDQLGIYLAKYVQPAEAANEPSTSAAPKDTSSAFAGMKALSKETKEDPEFGAYMSKSTPKKGKGKKGGNKQNTSAPPSAQKLNQSLDMMEAFFKLKISVPMTTDQVPAAMEEVEKSKKYWLKKREEAKASGVLHPEEAASSSAPNGVPKPNKKQTPTEFKLDEWPDIAGNVPAPSEDEEEALANGGHAVKVTLKVDGERVQVLCN